MAAASRRASPPSRARRSRASTRPQLPTVALEPHHVDILALALIAAGIFLGGVAYAGWAGGTLGHGMMTGLRLLVGALAYAAPVGLVLSGGLVLARDFRPPVRPMRTGVICLTAALLLALAAGTLGLGPGRAPDASFWATATLERRGGVAGEVEFWVTGHLLSTAGADILAVFLLLAGIILVTGATLAGFVRATGGRVASTGRTLRRSTEEIRSSVTRRDREPSLSRRAPGRGDDTTGRGRRTTPEESVFGDPPDWDDTGEGGDGPSQARAPWSAEDLVPADPGLVEEPTAVTPGAPTAVTEVAPGESPEAHTDMLRDLDGLAEEVGADPIEGVETLPADGEREGIEPVGPARPVGPEDLTPQGRYRPSITEDPAFQWRVPSARSLVRSTGEAAKPDTAGQEQVARTLVEALGHFGIQAQVIGRVAGPHITRYELRLAPGTKVAKVAQLKDDIAYSLAATDIRILAPIPGKQAVGVEVPNARRRIVHLGDVFQEPPEDWSPLTVWLGKDIAGRAVGADLAKMPHLLVAGTTGAGKSACINSMLTSVLLRATPHEVRVVLVDPKQVELNHYDSIPHLLTPVITSPRMAANALQNLVREMEQRYGIMSVARTRSLPELNRVRERRGDPSLPYILCVIDELADLMMVAPADVEDSIIRLAQKARAVGIHLVLATQSPRVDVITGMIKANVPSRIAFAVSSQTDSRVILDQNGAEALLGQGDMLFSPVGSNRLQRIQGAFIDEEQILDITEAWRRQGEPEFRDELLEESAGEPEAPSEDEGFDPDEDPLLEEAITLVAEMGTASTSMLQRRLRLGYTRAGRLIDMLERRGVISGYEGSKPRQVLVSAADLPRVLASLGGAGADAGEAAQDTVRVPDDIGDGL